MNKHYSDPFSLVLLSKSLTKKVFKLSIQFLHELIHQSKEIVSVPAKDWSGEDFYYQRMVIERVDLL